MEILYRFLHGFNEKFKIYRGDSMLVCIVNILTNNSPSFAYRHGDCEQDCADDRSVDVHATLQLCW